MDFKTLGKKWPFVVSRIHHQNFSFQFEANLLEQKLGLRSTMAMIYTVCSLLNPIFDSSRFTSNLKLKFWSWVLGTKNDPFFSEGLKSVDSPILVAGIRSAIYYSMVRTRDLKVRFRLWLGSNFLGPGLALAHLRKLGSGFGSSSILVS
jgi:hypothetical protein